MSAENETTQNGTPHTKTKRGKSLRRHIAVALVGVALVSVLLDSTVNYVFARLLIDDSVNSQLTAVRDTRTQAVEVGTARIQGRVSALAITPSVVDALTDLSTEYALLGDDITSDQVSDLTTVYETEVLPPIVAAGVDIPSSELVPASAAGRYVQYHYIAENPNGADEREQLDDAGDGSGYSAAHADHHPLLRALMENARMSDLLLVDDTGAVVYSTMKRIDLGTSAFNGPYADSGLGVALDKLSGVAVGNGVISDSFFYVPTAGDPVFFVAAAVRSGTDVVGAVVTTVPVEALTAIMTADQDWKLLGLGETGESYIVGADGTLRSDSRAWLTDPADYLQRHEDRYNDPDTTALIEQVGSTVLLQEVDNAAVEAGLDGDDFTGTVTNYLGKKTLATSTPADIEGVDWVVVVELDRDEADAAIDSLLRRFLLVLAVLLPAIAILGVLLARTLTRPADSLVRSAARIADGDLDTKIDDLGKNELGDLGRQLEGVAHQLEAQEQAVVDEEQHINDMLRALLPARLVERVRGGEQAIGDIFDTATVVSITTHNTAETTVADPDLELEIAERMNDATLELMEQYGVERINRSSGSQLYLTGLDQDDAKVADAAAFTLAVMTMVADIGTEYEQPLAARAGLASGDVATGVLGTTQLSFGVWGDPTGAAVTLGSLARPGQILADGSVADHLDGDWDIELIEDFPGLSDDIRVHVINARVNSPAGGSSNRQ